MSGQPKLSKGELEVAASQHLGRLLFVFGRLEVNLSLVLANSYPPDLFDSMLVKIEAQSFAAKLESLRVRVERIYSGDAGILKAWNDWFSEADSVRMLRNRFAHGMWGFVAWKEIIAHVSGLPGSPNQTEKHYTLTQLAVEVKNAEQLDRDLSRLQERSHQLFDWRI